MALDGDEIVAVARYDGRAGRNTAEIAVTVEDAWQHPGVGQRLTKRLARRAIDHGIESFEAVVQPDNRAALGLLRKLSPDASVRFDGGEYAASMPLRSSTRTQTRLADVRLGLRVRRALRPLRVRLGRSTSR